MESLQDMMNRVKMNAYNKKKDAKEAEKKEAEAVVSVVVIDSVAVELVETKTKNNTFWKSFNENSESGMSGMNAL